MNTITFECEVVEYETIPAIENTNVVFSIKDKSVVINFTDSDENVLHQSEISIEDARKLAKLISI